MRQNEFSQLNSSCLLKQSKWKSDPLNMKHSNVHSRKLNYGSSSLSMGMEMDMIQSYQLLKKIFQDRNYYHLTTPGCSLMITNSRTILDQPGLPVHRQKTWVPPRYSGTVGNYGCRKFVFLLINDRKHNNG